MYIPAEVFRKKIGQGCFPGAYISGNSDVHAHI
jgi:hypothetical protein